MKRKEPDTPTVEEYRILTNNYLFVFPEFVGVLLSFLDDHPRVQLALTCKGLYQSYEDTERKELTQWWKEMNESITKEGIFGVLREPPLSEENIRLIEKSLGITLPFHLREFLKLTNGREYWDGYLFHPMNVLAPAEKWTKLQVYPDDGFDDHTNDSTIHMAMNFPETEENHVVVLGVAPFDYDQQLLLKINLNKCGTTLWQLQGNVPDCSIIGSLKDWLSKCLPSDIINFLFATERKKFTSRIKLD